MENLPKISIIVPILNEEKYIEKCLDSIVDSDYDKRKIEVFLVDGGSEDKTIDIIKEYQKKYPFFQLLQNPHKTVPYAMNIGIQSAKGEYIIRLDAHSSYPKDYFSKLIQWHKKIDADNVGGIWKTEVLIKTKMSNAIKNVLSDKFGVGGAKFRVGSDEVCEVDTVPFGCYKKEVFDNVGQYDERLTRNQDIELNKRVTQAGGKIYLVPDIACTYYARETYKELAKNNFQNGKWNMLTAYYTKNFRSLSIRHYIPMLFVLSMVLPLFCCYKFSIAIFTLYLSVIIWRSFVIKKGTSLLHQAVAFIVLHFSYGIGEIIGIITVLKNKLSPLKNL